jgi:hypothetical protein
MRETRSQIPAALIFLLLCAITIAVEGASDWVRLQPQGHRITPSLGAPASPAQSGYFDYATIVARLRQLQSEHPAIARVVDLHQLLQTPRTVEERTLWALKISDHVTMTEDEPAVVIDGLHHARELVTPHAVLDIAEMLTAQYAINTEVARWVDHYEIWLIPCVNPDGLEHVFNRNRLWRKNRRPNGNGLFGVDLNRNYPFGWGVCGTNSADPRSDVYRGPSPASEAEVQTMLALGARKRPILYLTYHSFGEEVLWPYRCGRLAEEAVYSAIGDQYAAAMQYDQRPASSSGESFEHFYNQFGSLAFLTEIGTEFQPVFSRVPALIERLRPGWQFLLSRSMGASIQGHVRNAQTREPVAGASISLDGIRFTEGEVRQPEPVFGRYHWIVQPGTYAIRFTAPGFQPQTYTVTVGNTIFPLDVELVPSAVSGR